MEDFHPKCEHNLFLGDFNVNLLLDSREFLDFCEKIEDKLNSSLALQSHQPQKPFPAYNFNPTTGLYSFRNVDALKVLNAISRVKSIATGLDGIPLKFIKLILPLIVPWITHISNTILTTSMFPKSWKIWTVIPIAKLKNPSSPGDYRPINILPSLSKALEIFMKSYHLHSSMLPMTFTKAANFIW
jgi:hypothetical protein